MVFMRVSENGLIVIVMTNNNMVEPHYYGHPQDWASDLNSEVTVLSTLMSCYFWD